MTDEFSSKRKRLLSLAAGATVAGLGLLGWCVWQIATVHTDSTLWVEHTHEVIAHIDAAAVQVEAAETGQRGFLLTDRETYLVPYTQALGKISHELDTIGELTRDNLLQQRNLARLRGYMALKLAELAETIRLRREAGLSAASALVLTDRGKLAMDDIQALFASMRLEEERLLLIRHANDSKISNLLYIVCAGILLVAVVSAAAVIWLLRWIGRLQTGLITVCAWTRQVHYQDKWMGIEEYLHSRFGQSITHGISDEAAAEMMKEAKDLGKLPG